MKDANHQVTMSFYCELTIDQGVPVNASATYDSKLRSLAVS